MQISLPVSFSHRAQSRWNASEAPMLETVHCARYKFYCSSSFVIIIISCRCHNKHNELTVARRWLIAKDFNCFKHCNSFVPVSNDWLLNLLASFAFIVWFLCSILFYLELEFREFGYRDEDYFLLLLMEITVLSRASWCTEMLMNIDEM